MPCHLSGASALAAYLAGMAKEEEKEARKTAAGLVSRRGSWLGDFFFLPFSCHSPNARQRDANPADSSV